MNDVCTGCGEPNPPGTQFCLFCGIYLGWEERDGGRPGGPAPRGSAADGTDQGWTGAAGPEDTQDLQRDRTLDLSPVLAGAAVPSSTPAPAAATAAAAPPVGTCPSCGRGNDPSRRFCGHCGVVLTAGAPVRAPAPPRRTWWQRLLRSDTRLARQAYRRSLPALYRWRRVAIAGLLAVVVGGGLAVAGRDPVGFAVDRWWDLTDRLEPVQDVFARAEPEMSVVGDNVAEHVLDTDRLTAWVTGWTPTEEVAECGDARGGRLTLTFPATRVRELRVVTGVTNPSERLLQHVPARLDVVLPDGTCRPLTLGTQDQEQMLELDTGEQVTQLTISIGEVRTADERARDVAGLSQLTLMARPVRDR